ncbi:MAG: glycoside hydrolase family 88 protein [bacterium]
MLRIYDPAQLPWHWGEATLMLGMLRAAEVTDDARYSDFVVAWLNRHASRSPLILNPDFCLPAVSALLVYKKTKDEKYLRIAERTVKMIMKKFPRADDGTLYHIVPGQVWIDEVFMLTPLLAHFGVIAGRAEYIDEAIRQIFLVRGHTLDGATGLSRHRWSAEDDTRSPAVWARGNGWVVMAIAEVLDVLPADNERHDELVGELKSYVETLSRYQDASGLWHTVIDRSDSYLETSASAMFIVGFKKALKEDWVSEKYRENLERAIRGLISKIAEDGSIAGVSGPTNPGDFTHYQSIPIGEHPYGYGAVLLALTRE